VLATPAATLLIVTRLVGGSVRPRTAASARRHLHRRELHLHQQRLDPWLQCRRLRRTAESIATTTARTRLLPAAKWPIWPAV